VNRIVSRKGSPLRFFVLVFALSAPIWLLEPRDWRITASVGTLLVAALILCLQRRWTCWHEEAIE
jgi:hypothetical protein